MRQFLIGQYGGFDIGKYQRDYREEFYGIDACLFESEHDRDLLIQEAKRRHFRIGIHYPFRAGQAKIRDALFLSLDESVRADAFCQIQRELTYLQEHSVKPDHILFHFPKPVLIDEAFDLNRWRFYDPSEYMQEKDYPFDAFQKNCEELFQWLSTKGAEYSFTPVLEFDGLTGYVYANDMLESLLQRYPNVRVCLDTGRLFLQSCLNPAFPAEMIIDRFAPYAELIHLWTLRVTDVVEHVRYPALPGLDPADGWAPIESYLQIIAARNLHVKVLFEHRSDWVSDDDLQACYDWVHGILSSNSLCR